MVIELMFNAWMVWWILESYKQYTTCIDTRWYEKEKWTNNRTGLATFTFRSLGYCILRNIYTWEIQNMRAHLSNGKKRRSKTRRLMGSKKKEKNQRACRVPDRILCFISAIWEGLSFSRSWQAFGCSSCQWPIRSDQEASSGNLWTEALT